MSELSPNDKQWKKFRYDATEVAALVCADCNDKEECFTCLIVKVSV